MRQVTQVCADVRKLTEISQKSYINVTKNTYGWCNYASIVFYRTINIRLGQIILYFKPRPVTKFNNTAIQEVDKNRNNCKMSVEF